MRKKISSVQRILAKPISTKKYLAITCAEFIRIQTSVWKSSVDSIRLSCYNQGGKYIKVFKKLAAAGAAIMMAVTGMAMSASATDYTKSWMVRRVIINGSISSESVGTSTATFVPGTGRKVTRIETTCSYYSSGTAGNGTKLGADCWVSRCNYAGVVLEYKGYYHHIASGSSASFDMSVAGTDIVKAVYTIDNPYTVNCYISGTAKGTIINSTN